MAATAYGIGVTKEKQYHDRINTVKLSLFVREYFASMFKDSAIPMVILSRIVWKPDLHGVGLAFENVLFQQEVHILTLSETSFILPSRGYIKTLDW